MLKRSAWFAVSFVASLTAGHVGAAQPSDRPRPPAQVLVLGTYHFANPGLDVVKSEVADVLTPTRQSEIEQIVQALERFRPTKIALEVRRERTVWLDSLYAAYRSEQHTLSRNEVEQLGFRLADRLGHSRVLAIDHEGEFPFGALMQYAQAHDTAFVTRLQRATAEMAAEANRMQREETIGGILRTMNDPERIAMGHGFYLEISRVGAGDTYVGADLLAKWYARNIRIFSDLQRIAQPEDRILVIFGSGHSAILRELVTSDPDMQLVEALPFLPPRAGGGE